MNAYITMGQGLCMWHGFCTITILRPFHEIHFTLSMHLWWLHTKWAGLMHVSCVRTITIVIAFYGMVCWGGCLPKPFIDPSTRNAANHNHWMGRWTSSWWYDMIWYEDSLKSPIQSNPIQSNPITWVVCWYPTFRAGLCVSLNSWDILGLKELRSYTESV